MKNQYFGDVNDFKKYGLLRHLALEGRGDIAVCWTLTEDDGLSDGSRLGYLQRPERWRQLDPAVFDFVRSEVLDKRRRSVDALPSGGIIPHCRFFTELLTDAADQREIYFDRFFRFSRGARLVFFDPDNGLGITAVRRGTRRSSKYLYPCEVERAWQAGHSILFYQHFPRRPRDEFLTHLTETLEGLQGLTAVLYFITAHVVFVLLPRPEDATRMARYSEIFADRWEGIVRLSRRPTTSSSQFPVRGAREQGPPLATAG